MNIDRKEFVSSLKRAMPGIESGNSILEGADTFIFNNGFIHTYNDTISVSVPFAITNKVGAPISGALKAKEFYDLVNRYSDDVLKLLPKDGVWIIKSENAVAELVLLENTIIERVQSIFPDKIIWSKLPERFIDGISICKFSGNRSSLSGIFISECFICSTDEIRINWYDMDSNFTEPVWISDDVIQELLKLNNIKQYAISDSWIHFKTEDETIFSCKRLAQDKYPFEKIRALIEKHGIEKGDIKNDLPVKLIEAVNRAAALSQNIESFDTIKLTFSNEGIEVFSQRPSGKYTEQVAWETAFKKDIEPVSMFVDYVMIENGIKYSKSFYLKKTIVKEKEVTRIIFKHEFGMQLISTFDGANK